MSSKDKTDNQKVVTVGYYTQKGTRYCSIHAHEDGTWKEFFSRAGKGLRPKDDRQEKGNAESDKET